jgi:hypothetical protein
MPDHLLTRGFIMLAAVAVLLGLCQLAFGRMQGKIAERL